ncbi:hypothetical protein LTS10_009099 [Elasticomyces elasticus]|nr:hypothetical protein LTS10_009099 [Elasticomyces elasticus]
MSYDVGETSDERATAQRVSSQSPPPSLNDQLLAQASWAKGDEVAFVDKPLRRKLHRSTWFDDIQDTWVGECTACGIAFVILGIQCGLLGWSQHQPVSHWSWNFQLNSMLALLTTCFDAVLMYALASCLGQLKWLWFRARVGYLIWLDRFAHASTAVGSISLLSYLVCNGFWRTWACPAAVTVLALLGTGLFVQNIVVQTSTTTIVAQAIAWIWVAHKYDIAYEGEHLGDETPVAGMIASVVNGFAQPFVDNGSPMDLAELMKGAYACGTTNCTLGTYSSLSVCPLCVDISYKVNVSGDFAALPNEYLTLSTNGLLNITSDTRYPDSKNFSGIGPLIVHYTVLAWGYGNVTPAAVECVAYWCVSTYQGDVISNALEEKVLHTDTDSSAPARTSYPQATDIVIRPQRCWFNNVWYDDSVTCAFTVAAKAQRAIQNFLSVGVLGSSAFLSGHRTTFGNSSRSRTSSIAAQILGDPCAIVSPDMFTQCNSKLYAGLEASFTNMTTFMTQAVRTGNNNDYFSLVLGNASTTAYIFEVRWAWMAYPASTLLLATAVVVGTVLQSRGEKSWKLSMLPAVYHGIRDLNDEDYKRLVTPAQMRYEAEQMSVKLDRWGEGLLWRTVKQL